MKHSNESVKKAMDDLKARISVLSGKRFDELVLHISTGNRKIGRVHNFSMAPGITCANCTGCLAYCYDVKAVLQYPNVAAALAENTVLMKLHREETFQAIDRYISTHKANKFFRWHVSGEILDVDYFDRMVRIARHHPDWVFWTYTKNYRAVNEWIRSNGGSKESVPANLSVMFSV